MDMGVAPRCNGLRHAMMILEANDVGCLDPVSCLLPCQDPNCYRLCGSNIVFDLGGISSSSASGILQKQWGGEWKLRAVKLFVLSYCNFEF